MYIPLAKSWEWRDIHHDDDHFNAAGTSLYGLDNLTLSVPKLAQKVGIKNSHPTLVKVKITLLDQSTVQGVHSEAQSLSI